MELVHLYPAHKIRIFLQAGNRTSSEGAVNKYNILKHFVGTFGSSDYVSFYINVKGDNVVIYLNVEAGRLEVADSIVMLRRTIAAGLFPYHLTYLYSVVVCESIGDGSGYVQWGDHFEDEKLFRRCYNAVHKFMRAGMYVSDAKDMVKDDLTSFLRESKLLCSDEAKAELKKGLTIANLRKPFKN